VPATSAAAAASSNAAVPPNVAEARCADGRAGAGGAMPGACNVVSGCLLACAQVPCSGVTVCTAIHRRAWIAKYKQRMAQQGGSARSSGAGAVDGDGSSGGPEGGASDAGGNFFKRLWGGK
jgi:hypothetical protein